MEKGIHLKSKELKDKLTQDTVDSGLPAVIIRFTLEELLNEIRNVENRLLEREIKEYQERKEEKDGSNKKSRVVQK